MAEAENEVDKWLRENRFPTKVVDLFRSAEVTSLEMLDALEERHLEKMRIPIGSLALLVKKIQSRALEGSL